MDSEIWRDISGYDGKYQVSNFGRVKSFKSGMARILKPGQDRGGYLTVHLSRDNKGKKHRVHRLVAEAFIPNPDGKPQVNHIDGVKTNNHVNNLEWVTPSENIRHALATGLFPQGEDRTDAKLTNAQVVYIRENPDGLTCAQLGEMFGVDDATIGRIQCGKCYRNAGGKIRNKRGVPDDIRDEIRRLYVKGSHEFGLCTLAERFNCSQATIWNILNER